MKQFALLILVSAFVFGGCEKDSTHKITYNVYLSQNSDAEVLYRSDNNRYSSEELTGGDNAVWTKSFIVPYGFKAAIEIKQNNPKDPLTGVVIEIVRDNNIVKSGKAGANAELHYTVE